MVTPNHPNNGAASDSLLKVEELEVAFDHRPQPLRIVRKISFAITKGETLALVGESGSGKSITALSIMRLLPPNARISGGRIEFAGRNLLDLTLREMRALRGDRIGMIFQEPMSSLNPLFSIGEQIREVLHFHKRLGRKAARERALELLDLVGMPNAQTRLVSYPHELSGGQLQRVMIAMALANDPDLLIADEPTTALDVTIQLQILTLLKELQRRLGLALLLITHDFGVVRRMADHVCVMNAGELVERGTTSEIFNRAQHPYTRKLLDAEPAGVPRGPLAHAEIVMAANDVRVSFPIKSGLLRRTTAVLHAVDGINVTIREGQTIGVVGESGSGKTTLGRALLRLVASTGAISFEGRSIQGVGREVLRPLRRRMQIVFQDPYGSLSPRRRIGQIIGEGLVINGIGGNGAQREAMIVRALEEVGLDPECRRRYPHEFSGGQRQRIAIARAIVLRPRFVVLDEPTSALDRSIQSQIIDLLRKLQERHNLAYLFISHDLKVVRAMANEVIVMKDGRAVEAGSAKQIFDAPREEYTSSLIRAAFDTQAPLEAATAAAPGPLG